MVVVFPFRNFPTPWHDFAEGSLKLLRELVAGIRLSDHQMIGAFGDRGLLGMLRLMASTDE